jgi:hypothetical protein
MSILLGIPQPQFVIHKAGSANETVTLDQHSDYRSRYTPDFLSHEDQEGTLTRKLLGFRFRAELYFEIVDGTELVKLARLMHQVVVNGVAGYDTVDFYPHRVEKPYYFEDVTIDDDDIEIQYMRLLANKDFTLKLIGRKRVDWIPLTLANFVMWGSVSLRIQDVTQLFSELT